MSCFSKRVDIPGDRRKAVRSSASATGSAVAVHDSRSIVVEDLGPHGAKICGHGLPAIGTQVLIWTDELDVLGSVVWAHFRQRGIAFDPAEAKRSSDPDNSGSHAGITFSALAAS